MELTIHLHKLHPAQRAIADSPARFKVLACGRRFGKTDLITDTLVNRVLDGQRAAYFAPTYKMASDVWRALKHILQPVTVYKNESERRIETLTGGIIDCWSLDNADSVRGRKYHYLAVDEAALVASGKIWPAVLRPLLTDYRGGALFAGTPKGLNWFHELYGMGLDPLQASWASWNFPTTANPYIDPAEVEEARASVPERWFRQEYLATFEEDAGAVFRAVDEACTAPEVEPREGGRYVFGVDWARAHDYTVISVIDADTRQQVAVDRFNQISWQLQRGRLTALYERWKPVVIWAEENSIGGPNIEELQNAGLPVKAFQMTAQSKNPLIDALALALEQSALTLLNDPVQRLELKAYQVERLPSGVYRYNAPPGAHDDTVIALALAWHGVARQPASAALFSW